MNILAFFTENGFPKVGLTPIIRILDINDSTSVVTDDLMIEVGDGFYKYNFVTYDGKKDYAIRCDGGPSQPVSERFTYGNNDSFSEDIADQVWDEQLSQHQLSGSMGVVFDAILNDLVTINSKVDIIKGLTHENIQIDQTVYDEFNNLEEARLRIYSNAASVGTNTNIIATYKFESTGTAPGKFDLWRQIKQ